MEDFVISGFKYGLDTRKDVLTAVPGTLVTCQDCHINPGGEIEKRKTFASFADASVLDNQGEVGMFGIEVTAVGIVRFGSARNYNNVYVSATGIATTVNRGVGVGATLNITAVNGAITVATVNVGGSGYAVGDILSLVTARGTEAMLTVATLAATAVATVTITNNGNEQLEPFLASAVPTGVTYQQLKHPSLYNDSTEDYVFGRHNMTQVVFSENFNGKAFVGAKFDDDRTFLYFDGELVQHSANGVVMEGRVALADLANDLARQLRAVDWVATPNVDENAVAQNGSLIAKSPPQNKFTPVAEDTSSAGALGHKFIAQDGSGTAGVSPSAGFDITVNPTPGVGTITITAPSNSLGTNYVDIMGGPVTALGTAALTAAAIVQTINDLTFIYGYRALISGTTGVLIFADETYGPSFTFELRVDYTSGTVAALVGTPLGITVLLTPNPVFADETLLIGFPAVVRSCSAAITGGSGTYTILWSAVNANGISIVGTADESVVTFEFNPSPIVPGGIYRAIGSFQCRVRDNAVPVAETIVPVTVDLTLRILP